MSLQSTYTGAPWRAGLPPGVYRESPRARALELVRMDVTGFVGLCERGPLDLPVPLEGWGAFRFHFGRPGGTRQLPDAVRAFFRNGGRRCVVVRSLGDAMLAGQDPSAEARPARWRVPGVGSSTGAPFELVARSAGTWALELRGRVRWRRRPLDLRTPAGLDAQELSSSGPRLEEGALVAYRRTPAGSLVLRAVDALRRGARGEQVVRLGGVLRGAPVPLDHPDERSALARAFELRLELELELDGRHGRERWVELALDPRHPRYVGELLARRSASEALQPSANQSSDPAAAPAEPLAVDARDAGSRHVRLDAPSGPQVWLPAGEPTDEPWSFGPPELVEPPTEGGEAIGPGSFLASVAALARYDERAEYQPVAFVHLPDLCHPGVDDAPRVWNVPDVQETTTSFAPCGELPLTPPAEPSHPRYPLLAGSSEATRDAMRELVACVEADAARGLRRIAMLDAPPGLGSGGLATLRRELASDRAALFAPWLWTDVSADEEGAGLSSEPARRLVPPAAFACGVAASREAGRGAFAAPAGRLVGVVGLYADAALPDAAFLHEERIDAVRATERGWELLGARTTSTDADWTHLGVRRLIDQLALQLALDARWAVFEPNDDALIERLRAGVERRLEALRAAGGLAGADATQAWFVRSATGREAALERDEGRASLLVGVAPTVPAEFLVYRLSRESEGAVALEGPLG